MEQFTLDVVEWVRTLPPVSIYLVFLAVAYLENLVPPIPGDILVAFGGYLAAESLISLTPVFLITTLASVAGFMTMYRLGSMWGMQIQDRKKNWIVRFIPFKYVQKARQWMGRWGQGVVMANRFLAGTRSVIAITAGISHTPPWRTAFSSLVSSILWNGILLGFGWIVHENWHTIGSYLSAYGQAVLVLIVLFIAVRIGIWRYRRRAETKPE